MTQLVSKFRYTPAWDSRIDFFTSLSQEDRAKLYVNLSSYEQITLFGWLSHSDRIKIFMNLNKKDQKEMLNLFSRFDEYVCIYRTLPIDSRADFYQLLGEENRKKLYDYLSEAERIHLLANLEEQAISQMLASVDSTQEFAKILVLLPPTKQAEHFRILSEDEKVLILKMLTSYEADKIMNSLSIDERLNIVDNMRYKGMTAVASE